MAIQSATPITRQYFHPTNTVAGGRGGVPTPGHTEDYFFPKFIDSKGAQIWFPKAPGYFKPKFRYHDWSADYDMNVGVKMCEEEWCRASHLATNITHLWSSRIPSPCADFRPAVVPFRPLEDVRRMRQDNLLNDDLVEGFEIKRTITGLWFPGILSWTDQLLKHAISCMRPITYGTAPSPCPLVIPDELNTTAIIPAFAFSRQHCHTLYMEKTS
ncbi:hypothetical protein MMC17_004868 [Xylographa soralifera]|nr:hypothetical protein [Xylographa soralifera]